MSEIEDGSSSVIDLELIAQQELKKKNHAKTAKDLSPTREAPSTPPETELIEQEEHIERESAVEVPESVPADIPSLPEIVKKKAAKMKPQKKRIRKRYSYGGDKQARLLTKKYDSERKIMQKHLTEQAKKRERDIRDLMEKALKEHFAQVDKERGDYLALLSELKETIEAQTKDALQNTQHLATSAAEGEVERMVNWFQDEFMKELDKKSQEYEELKTSSEEQVNKMTEESDGKSQQIMMLDEKIKEIASLLPKDVRQEVYEELGLTHLAEAERKAAEQAKHEAKAKAGFLSRISQLFKRSPRKVNPKPKPKKEKEKHTKKTQRKRAEPQEVIAQQT